MPKRVGLNLTIVILSATLAAALPAASEDCTFKKIYCKARTDRVAMIKSPTVRVNCNLDAAVEEALIRLWNQCGGIHSTQCQKPISCFALDATDSETEVRHYPR